MLSTELNILLQFLDISNVEIEQLLKISNKKEKHFSEYSNKYFNSLKKIVEFEIPKINNNSLLIYSFFNVKFKLFKIVYLFFYSLIKSKNYLILYRFKNNYEIIYTNQISRYNLFNENKIKSFLKDIKKFIIFFYCINKIKYITLIK
tara:strand:+ start:1528 stop:1968 length:441 start_codon:yes stop_codon:yes gene_type:complete